MSEKDATPAPIVVPRQGVMYESGHVSCDEPCIINGEVVGYCLEPVWPKRLQSRWRRRPGNPGKPHRIEWWT